MALQQIQEFKTAPYIIDKLLSSGIEKLFSIGEFIVNENASANPISIFKKRFVKVMQICVEITKVDYLKLIKNQIERVR